MARENIVVGFSGGVDSSVAAYLLKSQGYTVTGLFMKNWEDDDTDAYCSSRQDWIDAAAAADVLQIELEAVNFAAEYKQRVFAHFLHEYEAGRTPNPDVLCNSEIKFRAFLDHAQTLGAQRIATGHYARVRPGNGGLELLRGVDPNKDQSYFLHRLSQAQLSRTLFPVGHLHKSEVRALAQRIGLPNAAKRDSTGICFIGERPFREFLNRYLPNQPGPIRVPDGRVVGKHVGLSFYTLGQRKGIGVGGQRRGSGEAWFVARKDLASNTLWIVQGRQHPWLQSRSLRAIDASWIAGGAPDAYESRTRFSAKIRYRQIDAPCQLHSRTAGNSFVLDFEAAQWAPTPGQSAVLYDGELCLGGGVIDHVDELSPASSGATAGPTNAVATATRGAREVNEGAFP